MVLCFGCKKKNALFNIKGKIIGLYCGDCKLPEMVDVKNKKCIKCNIKQPVFNTSDKTTPKFCGDCKSPEMVDVKNKKCIKCNIKQPVFNTSDKTTPEFCGDCKSPEMVDVKNKKCIKCNIKQPTYNTSDKSTPEFCGDCKSPEMVDVVSKKCITCNKNRAIYNSTDKPYPEYCKGCSSLGMVNFASSLCKNPTFKCYNFANKNYNNMCMNCFIHLNPNDPRTLKSRPRVAEMQVMVFINNNYEGFVHNKPFYFTEIPCDCSSRRRIDHYKLIGNTILAIETDSDSHSNYTMENETIRYNDLTESTGMKYIFIRLNTNKYTDAKGKSCNPFLNTRLNMLKRVIDYHIMRIENDENADLNEIHYLYYDEAAKRRFTDAANTEQQHQITDGAVVTDEL